MSPKSLSALGLLDASLSGLNSDLLSVLAASSPSLPSLRSAHALLTVAGAADIKPIARQLVSLYLRHPSCLDDALLLHSRLRRPDHIAANLILKSLVRLRRPWTSNSSSSCSDAIDFFCRQAHPAGYRPSRWTFPLLITAAKLRESIHQGEIFHCLAVKLGFLSHLCVSNSLIHMYASCDGLDLARQLFDEMPEKDRISYNSIVDGYVKSCNFYEAEQLFWSTPDRNVISWSTLFNGYVRNRLFHKGMRFFHQMQEFGVQPDDCSVVSLLSVYTHFKLLLHGKAVHGFVVRRWSQMPLHVSNAFVDLYCKCGMLNAAVEMFEKIPEKDLICWNTLISGLGSCDLGDQALATFQRMLHEGVKPDDITFLGVLVACAHSGLVEEALRYFKMMKSEFGFNPSFAHFWCLVDLYVRSGSHHDALKVIQEMPLDDQSSIWGAVIWLAKVHGDISVGEYLGKCLIELEPENARRYVPLVNLYAAASRWDKYKELQEAMKAKGLKKLPDCTLIDLNVVVHKFSVGDKSRPEIEKIYEVLKEIAEQLNLQTPGSSQDAISESI